MRLVHLNALIFLFFWISSGFESCKVPTDRYSSPPGYDFHKPDKFNMPYSLLEISGIAFHDGKSDTVYSIQDEDGRLYRQKWDEKKQHHLKFANKGDYEDLAILHDRVFVLQSNGHIFSFPFSEVGKEETKLAHQEKHLLPKGEYESLYADQYQNKLYILCKNCPGDKKAKMVTGYIIDYEREGHRFSSAGSFSIDVSRISDKKELSLRTSLSASALTRNPDTGEWYILSSANKMLLITDAQWKLKAAHRLNSSTFNQPEGLAFDNQLNLYISNEGDEITDGNILKFRYEPAAHQ